MKKYQIGLVILMVGLAFNTSPLQAEIFFDTGPFNPSTGWTITGDMALPPPQIWAEQVTTAADWQLDNLTIAAWHVLGSTRSVTVNLLDDNGGTPGDFIDGWDIPITEFPATLATVPTPSAPVLSADTPYWFVMVPSTADQWAAWNLSTTYRGPIAFSTDGGTTWMTGNDLFGTLRLDGTRKSDDVETRVKPTPVTNNTGNGPSTTVID